MLPRQDILDDGFLFGIQSFKEASHQWLNQQWTMEKYGDRDADTSSNGDDMSRVVLRRNVKDNWKVSMSNLKTRTRLVCYDVKRSKKDDVLHSDVAYRQAQCRPSAEQLIVLLNAFIAKK